MPTLATRRVNVEFPEPLLSQTEEAAAELRMNRSLLIRTAVEEFLKSRKRALLEQELALACEANDDLARNLCEEFTHIDTENI